MDPKNTSDSHQEARDTMAATVEQLRVLAAAEPETYLHQLADCLGQLGVAASRLEQHEAAAAAFREAAELTRKLATERPEMRPLLAMHLHNLGISQGLCQMPAEEFASLSESVVFLRQLASSQPEEYLPRFAFRARDLAEVAQALGQQAAARFFTLEALDAFNALAEKNPELFLVELAWSFKALGIVMLEAGRREDALAAYHMAFERLHAVAQIDPERVPTAELQGTRIMVECLQNPE
ncbi:MAG TPA: hypothetical protein PK156_29255, partial [Polyangium sp.]|nr:hypothetical protein [Polyangium sp.]